MSLRCGVLEVVTELLSLAYSLSGLPLDTVTRMCEVHRMRELCIHTGCLTVSDGRTHLPGADSVPGPAC